MSLEDRRLGLWGFGMEGRAALARLGEGATEVTIVADADPDGTLPAPDERTRVGVGSEALEMLLECDTVIVSPGIPGIHPLRSRLVERGVELTSVTDLWLRDWAQVCLGVTGTKGKSTTAALGAHVLRALGREADLAGNIGRALFEVEPPADLVVAELGSYQCSTITRSPRVAVLTNLYEDHLTWFGGDRDAYWRAKSRIATQGAQVLVCDAATLDSLLTVVPRDALPTVHVVDPEHPTGKAGPIPLTRDQAPPAIATGHQWRNATLALAAVSHLGDFPSLYEDPAALVAGFAGLPYRLETVSTQGGAEWVVDTLSTTAESVVAALDAYPGREMVLLVGGQDRGIDYAPVTAALLARAAQVQVVCLPSNGRRVVEGFAAAHPARVHDAVGMVEAVDTASALVGSLAGSRASAAAALPLVLLSPGAPSYDHYRDYRDKAGDFCAALASRGLLAPTTKGGDSA